MIRLILALSGFIVVSACSKKDKSGEDVYLPKGLEDSDALPVVSRLPTRPEGGSVPGKVAEMDPEESARRKARNEIVAIEFGASAAGINMKTTKNEARTILAAPLGASQGFEFYPEHIRILWDDAAAPAPRLLVVDEGYAGRLSLPAPYGNINIGQSLTALRPNFDIKEFMLAAGAAFEGMAGKAYNCEEALTCRLVAATTAFELQFRRGGMLVSNDASKKLQLLYFQPTQKFYPRVTGPIVYGSSIGGVDFMTLRSSFEAKYGPPEEIEQGFAYYDQGSIRIGWGTNRMPLAIGALRTFSGSMNFGATIGERKIGDSFKAHMANADQAKAFMLAIDRHFENRAPDFDCSTQTTPLCSLETDGELILIELAKGIFVFTADSEKRFLLYQVVAP